MGSEKNKIKQGYQIAYILHLLLPKFYLKKNENIQGFKAKFMEKEVKNIQPADRPHVINLQNIKLVSCYKNLYLYSILSIARIVADNLLGVLYIVENTKHTNYSSLSCKSNQSRKGRKHSLSHFLVQIKSMHNFGF